MDRQGDTRKSVRGEDPTRAVSPLDAQSILTQWFLFGFLSTRMIPRLAGIRQLASPFVCFYSITSRE